MSLCIMSPASYLAVLRLVLGDILGLWVAALSLSLSPEAGLSLHQCYRHHQHRHHTTTEHYHLKEKKTDRKKKL